MSKHLKSNGETVHLRWLLFALLGLTVIVLLAILIVPVALYPRLTEKELDELGVTGRVRASVQNDRLKLQADTRNSLIPVVGGFALISGAFVAWSQLRHSMWDSARQRQVASDALLLDQYTRAIEHLGNTNMNVRTAAVFSLHMLAEVSEDHREAVGETLAAFVRQSSPWPPNPPRPPIDAPLASLSEIRTYAPDVQAAMTALGRHTHAWYRTEGFRFRLTDLRRVNLAGGRFEGGKFTEARLQRAWMPKVRLDGASLRGADLRGAELSESVLTNCNLRATDFSSASLHNAELDGAVFDALTVWPANLGADEAIRMGARLVDVSEPPTSMTPKNLEIA
jgi:uncharacterized protein YjbI with pentapeptide repeats